MTLTLKTRISRPGIIQAPGVFDALGALLVEQAGFEAVYVSGAGLAYTQLGRPDLGLVYPDELLLQVGRITDRVHIPVIVDADTGFGGVLNIQRIVRALDRFGVSAIQIEDQVFPKRCGHLDGKEVVSSDEMVARIHAAVDTRSRDDLLVIARTDAVAVEGMASAIDRLHTYKEAGADVLFVDAPTDRAMLVDIVEATRPLPAMANMVEGGKTPILSAKELESIGFRLVIYPNSITRRMVQAAQDLLHRLKEQGTTETAGTMVQFAELNQLLGRAELAAWEDRWKHNH